MLSWGCPGSIHRRLSSTGQSGLFFQELQLDVEHADLPEQFVLLGIGPGRAPVASVLKDLWQAGQGVLLPDADQVGMHVVHFGNLGRSALRLNGFHRYFCFQTRSIALAIFGHRLLSTMTLPSTLEHCPNFGVHFRAYLIAS